ncbi:hypothetical protein SAMN05428957_10896 [Oryzisolibacter propanilivorax]|uniref:Glycine-rich domain-containing protein n=1 Tax=Oryzisolibacter propanilivorax TaxID=1527607 RepID=A0A1G9UC45_9BURK|nr:hypothetical protein [Oryzisolibacter propanilivorax]SDM57432.1 hypothetical protein SAMN05428957_10896 [Oryzisolibacter propanilivorax]
MPIAPIPLALLSPAPTLADPENFDARADVTVSEIVALVPRLNEELQGVYANAVSAQGAAAMSEAAVALASYRGTWSSLAGPLAPPATTLHVGSYWMLMGAVANVAASEPGSSNAWKLLNALPPLVREARAAAAVIGAGHMGRWIDITGGTFTQAFAPCAQLGGGWWCYLGNSGSGDITLDPAGAETIDGLASFVMYPGEVRLVQCDGVALRSVVLKAFSRTFTVSGNFIHPPGYAGIHHMLWGAGSGGTAQFYGSNAIEGVDRSAGGACAVGVLPASLIAAGATVAIIIGAGGPGAVTGSDYQKHGSPGGNSSIGTLVTAPGGGVSGGTYGVAAPGFNVASDAGGSAYGGASRGGGGRWTTIYGGGTNSSGPTTIFGGEGGGGNTGAPGSAPGGAGGSKTVSSGTAVAGNGARGECRLRGVI